MAPIRILRVGGDPYSVARSRPDILDGNVLAKELEISLADMKTKPGLEVEICRVVLEDENPSDLLREHLRASKPFDGVVIGWGLRGFPEHTRLFEQCLEVLRRWTSAETKLLFSTNPGDHWEAVKRGFKEFEGVE